MYKLSCPESDQYTMAAVEHLAHVTANVPLGLVIDNTHQMAYKVD